MVERRKFERYELAVPADIRTLARAEGKRALCLKTANVCAGGAYFLTDASLSEGTKVALDLYLSFETLNLIKSAKSARIRIRGTVTRSRRDGMAIRFSEDYLISPLKT